jgi:hypothetical protein
MFGRGEDAQSPGEGLTTAEEPIDALRARLDDDESIVYRLEGSGPLVREGDATRETLRPASGSVLAALTDRHVYFAAATEDGVGVQQLPFRDVRSVSGKDGLLRSRLSVRVWNDGTYRLPMARGQAVAEAADYLDRASETAQRVVAALETAREHVTDLGQRLEAGDADGVETAHEAVREQLSLARSRIESGPAAIQPALHDRVAEVATELQRTRMRAHIARGSTLVEEGTRLTDREAWDAAVAAYCRARDHFETARDISATQGFGLEGAIRSETARLERREDTLGELPLHLAEDARAAAEEAEDLEQAVPAWAAALEHYRAALTAGWGTPIDFDGDEETLRMQVEWAAAQLIEARRDLADRLRREGDDHRMAGEALAARDCYEAALSQLGAADRIASELRAGDSDAIADQQATIRERFRAASDDTDGDGGPTPLDPADAENSAETGPSPPA